MVLAVSDRVSPAPPYSGYWPAWQPCVYGAITLFGPRFPAGLHFVCQTFCRSYNPPAHVPGFGLPPLSLATTCGITVVFSSSGYLDVSVPRVAVPAQVPGRQVFNLTGSPIRTPADQRSFAPPRSFSQLTTSFVISGSQGIPHTPLFCFLLFMRLMLEHFSRSRVTRLLFYFLIFFFPSCQ